MNSQKSIVVDVNFFLENLIEDFSHVNESEIVNFEGNRVGFSEVFVSTSGKALSGGIHEKKDMAKRIAFAEAIERASVKIIAKDPSASKIFKLDKFPSTCGFACGFDEEKTKLRAMAEGLERWIWSQWIDFGYEVSEIVEAPSNLSPIGAYLFNCFESVRFFNKNFTLKYNSKEFKFKFGAVIGIKNGGVFPGSRVCGVDESPWEHGLIEAWRHLHIYKNLATIYYPDDFIHRRIKFFGENYTTAIQAIEKANKNHWPAPELDMLERSNSDFFSLWRCLLKNYIPWTTGDETRFVY